MKGFKKYTIVNIQNKSFVIYILLLSIVLLRSCKRTELPITKINSEIIKLNESLNPYDDNNNLSNLGDTKIKVNFKLDNNKSYDNIVVEDIEKLKKEGRKHSIKYYSYVNDYSEVDTKEMANRTYEYYDVARNKRKMQVNYNIEKCNYEWEDAEGVLSKTAPIGYKMSYGIDISKHNGDIDFKKVKDAGFEFAFIRIAYRGYGNAGTLKIDEMQDINLRKAHEAGLKVGAYVFSQSINEDEAIEEAKLAIELLKDYKLDLPIVFDPETIKGDIARTDDVSGIQFIRNAIAFCEEVKKAGFKPAIYSNLVWEDYYLDLEKLNAYEIWYADYNKIPQTPYNFKYWQFSEVGIVDGIKGLVDLNVMIE